MIRRIHYSLIALAAVALALAACGGEPSTTGGAVASVADETAASSGASGDDASATSTGAQSREDAMLDFARCMREHGIQIEDPKPGGPLEVMGKKGDEAKLDKAQKACQKLLQGAGGEPSAADKARFREAGLKFARCMREHGIDVPDPKGDGGFTFGPGQGLDPSDPKFQKAQKACGDGLRIGATDAAKSGAEGQ